MDGITVTTIYDDSQVRRLFEELPAAVQTRVLKPLMAGGAAILARVMKSEAPAESGLLRQSIGASAVRQYPTVLFVTAEVRRGFRRAVTLSPRSGRLRARSKKFSAAAGEHAQFRSPRKYLHLVVGGRKAVQAQPGKVLYSSYTNKFLGRSVAKATANPFVDRAFQQAQAQVLAYMNEAAPARIAAEANRLGT